MATIAAALLIGACTPRPATTVAAPPPEPAEALADFIACMAENGVDLAEGTATGDLALLFAGVEASPAVLAGAVSSCAAILDAGGTLDSGDEAVDAAVQARLVVVAACVRLRGVETFPDPVGGRIPLELVPFADPDLPAALDACRPSLPPATPPGG